MGNHRFRQSLNIQPHFRLSSEKIVRRNAKSIRQPHKHLNGWLDVIVFPI